MPTCGCRPFSVVLVSNKLYKKSCVLSVWHHLKRIFWFNSAIFLAVRGPRLQNPCDRIWIFSFFQWLLLFFCSEIHKTVCSPRPLFNKSGHLKIFTLKLFTFSPSYYRFRCLCFTFLRRWTDAPSQRHYCQAIFNPKMITALMWRHKKCDFYHTTVHIVLLQHLPQVILFCFEGKMCKKPLTDTKRLEI